MGIKFGGFGSNSGNGCGCCGPGVNACLPCGIPAQNLTVSWTNILHGNGSATMVYNAGTLSHQTASCVDNNLLFRLSCTGGTIELRGIYFTGGGGCPGGTQDYCSNQRPDSRRLVLASSTCTPFSLTFTVPGGAGCPALSGDGNTQFVVTL